MNSKQRRKARRDNRFRGLDRTVIEHCDENPYSAKMMNDFCEYIFDCRKAEFEFKCFGRYETCVRYQTGDLQLPVNGYDERGKGKP